MVYWLALLSAVGSTLTTWFGFSESDSILEWLGLSPGLLFGALVLAPIARRASNVIWGPIALIALSGLLYFAAFYVVANAVTGVIAVTGPRLEGPIVPVAALVSAAANGAVLASVAWLTRWRAHAIWAGAALLAASAGGALIGKGFTELSGDAFHPYLGPSVTAWVFAGFAVVQIPMAGILQLGVKDRRVLTKEGTA
jgi:hypothetical protein